MGGALPLLLPTLLTACGPRGSDTATAPLADDSGARVQSTPGWTPGQVQPCDSPAPAAAWRDDSKLLGVEELEPETPTTSLSLAPSGDDWMLATVQVPDRVRWWKLNAGTAGAWLFDAAPLRATLTDLDADGRLDLLAWGDRMHIGWAIGTDDERFESLWQPEDTCIGAQEIIVFDADGDGDKDVLMASSPGCDSDIGPTLLRQGPAGTLVADEGSRGGPWGTAFDSVVMDWDEDGDPDVYLCNDRGAETAGNMVMLNDGAGHFSRGDARGADLTLTCMSSTAADLDTDGRLDLHLAATDRQHALVAGVSGFVDAGASWGLPAYDGVQMPWGASATDLDNDGATELLVATSEFSSDDAALHPLELWHRDASGGFIDIGESVGLPRQAGTRAVLATDLDGDGIVDLLASDYTRTPWLFLSTGCTSAGWFEVQAPTGTRVEVQVGDDTMVALATDHPGMAATGPSVAHFGLGDADTVDVVRAWVPWHGEQILVGPLAARQRVTWAP